MSGSGAGSVLAGMSAPADTERVQCLEPAGVIIGYRVDIDPVALGLPVAAFARIRPTAQGRGARRGPTEDVLGRFLRYGQTVTSMVIYTPVPARPLPVDAGAGVQLIRPDRGSGSRRTRCC